MNGKASPSSGQGGLPRPRQHQGDGKMITRPRPTLLLLYSPLKVSSTVNDPRAARPLSTRQGVRDAPRSVGV